MTIIFLLLLPGPVGYAQGTIPENDISFDILKWHYSRYPKCEKGLWDIYEAGDGTAYRVDFTFEGNLMTAFYDEQGKVFSEEIDLTKAVPLSVVHYADDLYAKYKIRSFRKVTNFNPESVTYEMDLKTKEDGEVTLRFDRDLIPLSMIEK